MTTLTLILASCLVAVLGITSFKVKAARMEEKRLRKIRIRIDDRRG
ncbi:hypothetical protein [Limoniibacter endophyticus]|uniref:Uncharacterized protein n=1 Tax=Limoniibacter endophyticus TaxID=1565040 RepID=A0A8J3DSP7_9HYPH|nr:hypothetical protein [Limoniibacter endophyticus]GHC72838.1 hypothetical protein GCM10010136_20830 [Limoniibacter endophyticus]